MPPPRLASAFGHPKIGKGPSVVVLLLLWLTVCTYTLYFGNFSAQQAADPATDMAAQEAASEMAANPLTRLLKLLILGIGVFYFFRQRTMALKLLRQVNRGYVAFFLLATASVLWSFDPGVTIARLVGVCGSISLGLALCLSGWRQGQFQKSLGPILLTVLAGSLIFIVMEPQRAMDWNLAGYHGLTEQKNPFGMLSALGVAFYAHGWLSKEIKPLYGITGTVIAATCLALSRSATSILAAGFTFVFLVLLLRSPNGLKRHMRRIVISFTIVLLAYALSILKVIPGLDTILLGPIASITGKDMTFSNRSDIWEIIKEHIQYRPLLGSGYGAYWTSPTPGSQSYDVLLRLHYWPSESHNGYLEIINDLGYVGLLVLCIFLAIYVRQSLKLYQLNRVQGSFYLGLFFLQATTNLSESTWLVANANLAAIITVMSIFALSRSLIEAQAAQRAASQPQPFQQPPPQHPTPKDRRPGPQWRAKPTQPGKKPLLSPRPSQLGRP